MQRRLGNVVCPHTQKGENSFEGVQPPSNRPSKQETNLAGHLSAHNEIIFLFLAPLPIISMGELKNKLYRQLTFIKSEYTHLTGSGKLLPKACINFICSL